MAWLSSAVGFKAPTVEHPSALGGTAIANAAAAAAPAGPGRLL